MGSSTLGGERESSLSRTWPSCAGPRPPHQDGAGLFDRHVRGAGFGLVCCPSSVDEEVARRDLRSFCVLARRLRGQFELALNRLEIVARPPHIGPFWMFPRRVAKVCVVGARLASNPTT